MTLSQVNPQVKALQTGAYIPYLQAAVKSTCGHWKWGLSRFRIMPSHLCDGPSRTCDLSPSSRHSRIDIGVVCRDTATRWGEIVMDDAMYLSCTFLSIQLTELSSNYDVCLTCARARALSRVPLTSLPTPPSLHFVLTPSPKPSTTIPHSPPQPNPASSAPQPPQSASPASPVSPQNPLQLSLPLDSNPPCHLR